MIPSQLLEAAAALLPELTAHRRQLHKNPEVGAQLPETVAYVQAQLTAMGYTPTLCGGGVVATVTGEATERCVLLRADMDALEIREKTDLPFRADNGNMHACGHDMHTAMLLGAAKLLQDLRPKLKGTVKLVFQPDEEGLTGAKAMLSAGVLENPKPQAGMALHVISGVPSGMVLLGSGSFMAGCTRFRVTVTGKGCHGAMPETGVDPIAIGVQLHQGLQSLCTRETPARSPLTLTVGVFHAGDSPNVIPQEAVLEGSLRCFDAALTQSLCARMEEMAQQLAGSFRGSARLELLASSPPLVNDPVLTARAVDWARELLGDDSVQTVAQGGMGSEDFAAYTQELPCVYWLLGAGTRQEDPLYGESMHNEALVLNEEILPLGAALHTWYAIQYLEGAEEA